jgi:glycosyltransferase involved in cell wall biosynthesis
MEKICIAIPCYNEAGRLPFKEFEEYLNKNEDISFCFVNDGSTDNTLALLYEIEKHRTDIISIIDFNQNMGKAEAVRRGMLAAAEWNKFDFIGFFDADLSTPLDQLKLFLKFYYENDKLEIIIGSRVKRMGAIIERNSYRHYIGRIFATFASIILHLPVYDTQCGAKIFKNHLIPAIFEKPFLSKWFFDIEIFARIISKYGYTYLYDSLIEVPLLKWYEKGKSKLRITDFINVPLDLLKIHLHYRKTIKLELDIYNTEIAKKTS